ncbi:basic helix-loop-helix (bHLH) DNA-binding superfamily protein [Rhynchospora pubera]|uniref:Basic helix-loop-helix (BHLH) DNA-binding superfamily protein n=1 Tax=Rhynchospora pubera TaxID=906938 RepID=A0AAV8CAZ8_9POAL|nr:basic helix-loop-helix (bHLH) DNA-binding superfamily protein [Rhynchospora pubera]
MDANWFSGLGLQGPSFPHHLQGDKFDQFTGQKIPVSLAQNRSHEVPQPITSGSNINTTLFNCTHSNLPEQPKTIVKTSRWDSGITVQTSLPTILSFGAQVSTTENIAGNLCVNNKRRYDAMIRGEGTRKGGTKSTIYGQREREEHILAERKRRAKLSQRFIALSKIVPGLKKTDKTSVLGDAVKHIKHLQDKVQNLEAQATQQTIESAVIVKRSCLSYDEEDNADTNFSCEKNLINKVDISKGLPEIEAKMTERTAIIKIHCENRRGSLVKVLAEIEALGLSITSTNVMPFASSSLDITAIAQVEQHSLSVKDIVNKLNQAFKNFI